MDAFFWEIIFYGNFGPLGFGETPIVSKSILNSAIKDSIIR
jgi:hypothetical protein